MKLISLTSCGLSGLSHVYLVVALYIKPTIYVFSISVGYVTYLLPMNPNKPPASSNSTIVWKKVIIDKDNLWTKGQHRIIGSIVPLLRAKCPFKGEMDISKVKVQEDRNKIQLLIFVWKWKREKREQFTHIRKANLSIHPPLRFVRYAALMKEWSKKKQITLT